jgi:hypothetical protein
MNRLAIRDRWKAARGPGAAGSARVFVVALAAGAVLLAPGALDAQQPTYRAGQTVSPAYEGWTEHEDGSRSFLFGYMNRNWEEELDVPVGPDNADGTLDRSRLGLWR